MPIKSYLAHTAPNRTQEVARAAAALAGCTVVPAENRDALVLVTDTPSEEAEAALRAQIEKLDALASLTLVAAFTATDDLIAISPGATSPS